MSTILSTGGDNHADRPCGEVSAQTSPPVAGGLVQVRFTIPSLPPSVNSLYQIIYSQRRVELKPEARRWKSDSKGHVPRFTPREGKLVAVDATFFYRFHYANGKVRVFDAANLLKLMIDCIAEKCGFNDCLVRYGSWGSVDDVNERVEITLREVG